MRNHNDIPDPISVGIVPIVRGNQREWMELVALMQRASLHEFRERILTVVEILCGRDARV